MRFGLRTKYGATLSEHEFGERGQKVRIPSILIIYDAGTICLLTSKSFNIIQPHASQMKTYFSQNANGKYTIDTVAVPIAMVRRYVNLFYVFQM